MNLNYCSPNFPVDQRTPLKDYASNVDNIRQAKHRINELQNIINELNRSQNVKRSVSPISKSPMRNCTPPPQPKDAKPSPKFS